MSQDALNPEQFETVSKVQKALTPDLLSKDQQARLKGTHPTEGHCAVAAEATYHLLGGKAAGWVPVVKPRQSPGDNTHWWIEHKETGQRIDPTAAQFGKAGPDYSSGVRKGFMTKQPSKRAQTVIDRVRG